MRRYVIVMLTGLVWTLAAPVAHAEDSDSVAVDDAAPQVPKKKKPPKTKQKKAAAKVEEEPKPAEEPPPPEGDVTPKPSTDEGGLNFDLDVQPTTSDTVKVPVGSESAIHARRAMLVLHQSIGIALAAMMIGSVVTGQLNYSDKFSGGNSGRYELVHQVFVWPTEGLAAVTAGLAVFAPVPIAKESNGFDRMTLHKMGEFTAFAGWTAEAVLGPLTVSREGYANQKALGAAHLAIGYVTLAGMLLGLGAIVF